MANTLYDALIGRHAENEAVFLECDNGLSLSFAAFVRRAAQMAQVLAEKGMMPDDRVVVQTPKVADAVALYAGALQAGAVYLPLNSGYTTEELRYFCEDAAPRVIVCDPADAPNIAPLAADIGAHLLTLEDGAGTLCDAADAMPTVAPVATRGPNDLAALLYTSGTTGRSKGAMMSHRNLLSNAEALADLWRITDQDRLIHALPIFHTHGLFVALNTALLAGARVRLMRSFDLGAVLAELPSATLMMGVPTFYTRLLASGALTPEVTQNMRLFISGSAPLLAETHQDFEQKTGHRILERYGMTETNMITSNPYDGDRVAGTVGYALPGTEVKVTDPETGADCAAEEIGMIEVRGNNVFQGYWNMPEKTAEDLRKDGFFITGDLGVQAEDGRLRIVGRAKDLIISGGYNIYPKEIEDVLNTVAGVVESAVFGVADPDFGERVIAAVAVEPGGFDEERAKSVVDTKLARFKHPKDYVQMDALPRNAMGKVQKTLLRANYNT